MVSIYALIDPTTQQCRYVGKSRDLRARYTYHLWERQRTYKARWVAGLIAKGVKPEMVVLEEVPAADWPEHEQFWVAYFKFLGARLTNSTAGGEGGVFTAEIRAKLSDKARAQWADPTRRPARGSHTPARCEQQSATLKQYLLNPVARDKRVAQLLSHRNNPARLINLRLAASDPEVVEKRRLSNCAWISAHPEEVRELAARLQAPEIRDRCNAAKRSPEVRSKMSESAKKRWARDRDKIIAAQNEGKRNRKK